MKTLWHAFLKAHIDPRPWRIYEKKSRKLLCEDYGALDCIDTRLDNRIFVKADLKQRKNGAFYWRVVVE